jgi:hypothetical protein
MLTAQVMVPAGQGLGHAATLVYDEQLVQVCVFELTTHPSGVPTNF